jgi:biotin transport system substrate-specific component
MSRIAATLAIPLGGARTERILMSVFFLLATVLGAYVVIPLPFTPVPLTLQTLFVLLGATWLGWRWSLGVQSTYLGAGAIGASVFAGAASGLFNLAGPTAGYLWAFLPATILVGGLWHRASRHGLAARIALLASADLLILLMGTAWLGLLLHLPIESAILMGLVPFIPGEIVKVAIAAAAAPRSR